jgi:hypothetical protein
MVACPFFALDNFRFGLLLACTFFVSFFGVVAGYVWSGAGGRVLLVWGGDGDNWSQIGESGCASRNIKAGAVCDWLGVVDVEVVNGSTSIAVLLHWTLLVISSHRVNILSSDGTSSFMFFCILMHHVHLEHNIASTIDQGVVKEG